MNKQQGPPKFSLRLIRWLCKTELAEEIEGNLVEYHLQNSRSAVRFARLRYWFELINYLRPSTLKKFKYSKPSFMFNFNPLLTIRSLFKQGANSVINVLGFSLGLVCVFFLYFHIKSEMSYDDFHTDKDKIYRAVRTNQNETGTSYVGVTSGPYAPALKNDFPNSILATCRVQNSDVLMTYEDQQFFEKNILLADSNFFSFFSFPLLEGTPDQVLNGLTEAVLTRQTARKYFGNEDPIGKIIRLDNQEDFLVAGVMDNPPAKTHLGDFSMVLNINVYNLDGWWNNGLITYVKVESQEEAAYVNEQLGGFMTKYLGEDFKAYNIDIGLELEALTDIYFNNSTTFDWAQHGNLNTIYILSLVALAILLIACFNYVNLSVAQSFKRAKEIAVRKVLGGHKSRLVVQFLGESFTILLFATALAIGVSALLNPLLNNYFELNIRFDWADTNLLVFGVSLIFGTLLLAGLYPALLLSSFNPLKVMKGNISRSGKNGVLRKSLVIAQFLIAIFMIATTLLISRQMQFIQNKDLGFDREAVMMLDINTADLRSNMEAFKASFEDNPNILSVTAVGGEPGGFHDATTLNKVGSEENYRMRIGWGDEDYFETFGINIIHGRSFGQNLQSDERQTAVINEQAMKLLGLTPETVLETRVTIPSWDLNLRIIGVSRDYNFTSLKEQMEPLIIVHGMRYRKVALKMNAANLTDAISSVNNSWEQFSPDYPIEYGFLDESIARLYEQETKQSKVFKAFAGISIFLACMGVFGLATHTARQRQKELGIRKVLGATASQIIRLLSKEFVLLIVIAAMVAVPFAWYFMSRWLDDFAYQINISDNWHIFLLSGLAVGLIAFCTIGFKTWRAAVSNPTESIRYE
jgi:putative ABC transport system permease protein